MQHQELDRLFAPKWQQVPPPPMGHGSMVMMLLLCMLASLSPSMLSPPPGKVECADVEPHLATAYSLTLTGGGEGA
jgi:hypothetical protein